MQLLCWIIDNRNLSKISDLAEFLLFFYFIFFFFLFLYTIYFQMDRNGFGRTSPISVSAVTKKIFSKT